MILDRSGSMSFLEDDVIGGFNSFINEQKKIKDNTKVTTVLFDHEYEILHNKIDLQKIEPITNKQYYVRGSTALLDAIGRTINEVASYTKKKDNVLIVINTDGMENSSREFNNASIKQMVEHQEKKHNWKFIFLGANMDAFETGREFGIFLSYNVSNTSKGIMNTYSAVSSTVSSYRTADGATLDTRDLEHLDSK
jgi:hypothetical protein